MAKHKKQHYIPSSYLKAWCDPSVPKHQTPYVWRFDLDGSNPKRKAPENIFHETDMYTIASAEGGRDLVLEQGLCGLEGQFVRIRKRKLDRQEILDESDHFLLCAFIAAMHSRTPARREFIKEQWEGPLHLMGEMAERLEKATPEERARMVSAHSVDSSSSDDTITFDQVRQICANPLQETLRAHIQMLTPLLKKLDIAAFKAPTSSMFITSDHPCVWVDPAAHKRPPLYRSPALAYPTIEITLPISPTQIIWLNRAGISGYLPANSAIVNEFNRRTRFSADKYFVVNRNEIKREWFDPGVKPDDSWDKTHPLIPQEDSDR